MFELERAAIHKVFQLPRPTLRETLQLAAIYAAQAVLCTLILKFGYDWAGAAGRMAIVSAILVLQPGIEASLTASIARICANVVGAIVSIIIAHWLGEGVWQLLMALVIIVFACELLRLDMGLRAACVSAVIVMTFHDGRVVMTSVERATSVIIGSALALALQVIGSGVKEIMFGKKITAERAAASLAQPVRPGAATFEE